MRAAIALFLCFLIAFSNAATFSFIGNVTLTGSETDLFKLRTSTLTEVAAAAGYHGAFKTVNIGATGFNGVSGDVIFGEIYAVPLLVPLAYLSYWTGNATLTAGSIDFAASGALIGGVFVGLQEKTAAGADVTDHVLPFTGQALGIGNGLTWTKVEQSEADGLRWATVKGTTTRTSPVNFSQVEVIITFLVTDKIGVINKANTIVTPRTLETIVEIKNWPYADPANHIELKTGVASATGTIDGNTQFSAGTGINKVYATLQATAVVGGTESSVTVTGSLETNLNSLDTASQFIAAAVSAKYGGAASVAFFNVAFPAGANDIVWDPTFGQGEQLTAAYNPPSSAATLCASALVALFALVALLF